MASAGDRIEMMRLFIRIADAGSLSAAGKLVGLSQPSASRQLKHLESLLGVQLIQRSSSEFALTDAGEQFATAAVKIVTAWDVAAEAVRSNSEELSGRIRVAAPVASGQTVLSHIATDFILNHPGVTIDWRLVEEPGDMAAGGYDFWIKAGPILDKSLIVRRLWRADRSIVAAPQHPKIGHPSQLEAFKAVLLNNYVTRDVRLDNGSGKLLTIKMAPAFVTDNIFAALLAIRKGVGYGILPNWVMKNDLETGALVRICPDWQPPPVILSIAYPQSPFRPARVKSFLSHLRNELSRIGENVLLDPN